MNLARTLLLMLLVMAVSLEVTLITFFFFLPQ